MVDSGAESEADTSESAEESDSWVEEDEDDDASFDE